MAATSLTLVQPSSQISSNHLYRNNSPNLNNNNHVSFRPNNNNNTVHKNNNLLVFLSSVPQSTPLLVSGGGGRGGGGRGRFSSGAGGDGYYYEDDERMGPWDSFLEGLRLGFSTPAESSAPASGSFLDSLSLSNIIPNLVFCWVIEKNTGWFSGLFKLLENSKADIGANGRVTAA